MVNPHGFHSESPIEVNYSCPTKVQLINYGVYIITIHVTQSPTIEHFVMTHFGYSDRVWAPIIELDIMVFPSTEYAIKTLHEPPLIGLQDMFDFIVDDPLSDVSHSKDLDFQNEES